MDIREASACLNVPVAVLNRMVNEGLISSPLDEKGIYAVTVLGQLLGKKWFAGAVMKEIRMLRERITVTLFPDHDKIDRYILNSYLNETGRKQVSVFMLRFRLKKSFNADIGEVRIRKLRQVAYDIRRGRSKLKIGKSNITYAELLGIEIEGGKKGNKRKDSHV